MVHRWVYTLADFTAQLQGQLLLHPTHLLLLVRE